MSDTALPQSPTNATYVEPSAETILKPGLKLGDLLRRNMTQPYVLQRLTQRTWWVQSFNYGTVFFVGERGVLIFDTLEGVYDNIAKAVASVTDKPIRGGLSALPRGPYRRHRQVRGHGEAPWDRSRDHRKYEDPTVHGSREQRLSPADEGAEVAAR